MSAVVSVVVDVTAKPSAKTLPSVAVRPELLRIALLLSDMGLDSESEQVIEVVAKCGECEGRGGHGPARHVHSSAYVPYSAECDACQGLQCSTHEMTPGQLLDQSEEFLALVTEVIP